MGVFYGIKQPSSGQTGTLRNKQDRSGVHFRAWLDHGLLNQGLALAMKLNDHNFKGNEKGIGPMEKEGKGQGKRVNKILESLF